MILVTGATGTVGGELVRQLTEAGRTVRAWLRNREQHQLPRGVGTVGGDLNHPDSLSNQLRDVKAVFLLGGFSDMSGLLTKMRRAGVKRVVLLTSRSIIGGDPTNAMVQMSQISEDAVRSPESPGRFCGRAASCRMHSDGCPSFGPAIWFALPSAMSRLQP